MLFTPSLSEFVHVFDNWDTNPTVNLGTTITPGVSNAEGSWTQVATSGNISADVYGISLNVNGGFTSANAKNHLLDIGVDPAGGSSYTEVISNIVCGASSTSGGYHFFFPFFIKSGSSVAVRVQGSNATAGTISAALRFYGKNSRPETFPVGTFSETIGTTNLASSLGISFTPGNAADGAWASLGTTAKKMWWWQLCFQIDNGTITAEQTYIDLAWGDGSNKQLMMRVMHNATTSEDVRNDKPYNLVWCEAYHPLPGGTELWVRGRCLNAPDTGYNAVAIGIGG